MMTIILRVCFQTSSTSSNEVHRVLKRRADFATDKALKGALRKSRSLLGCGGGEGLTHPPALPIWEGVFVPSPFGDCDTCARSLRVRCSAGEEEWQEQKGIELGANLLYTRCKPNFYINLGTLPGNIR
jgi:hypothetical protein